MCLDFNLDVDIEKVQWWVFARRLHPRLGKGDSDKLTEFVVTPQQRPVKLIKCGSAVVLPTVNLPASCKAFTTSLRQS